jgi:hypothetical protein
MASVVSILGFGLLLLLYFISLVVSTLMPWVIVLIVFVVSVKIGLYLDKNFKSIFFVVFLPFVFLVLPSVWGVVSYRTFIAACDVQDKDDFVGRYETPLDGFVVDNGELQKKPFYKSVSVQGALYDAEKIKFYDMYFNNVENNFQREVYRRSKNSSSNVAEPPGEFVFKVLPIQRMKSILFSPIYKVSYQVEELRNHRVLARGSEYVLGGGLLGSYLKAIFGENFSNDREEYNYISCGYASKKPIAWRPMSQKNPSYEIYNIADAVLLKSIIY